MASAKQIAWRKKFARMSKAGKFKKSKSSSKPTHFYERREKLSQKKEVDSLVSWKEFKKVQKRALNKTHLVKGSYLFFKLSDGREALVIPSKFSDSWWKNATPKDLHRVFVV
jgi:hypothetical protein|tara:strand:- start:44 stop:379 length:336 start_codon:yes stop_codon:yes gene_type:complete